MKVRHVPAKGKARWKSGHDSPSFRLPTRCHRFYDSPGMIAPPALPDAHLFAHEAMRTTFRLWIVAENEPVARGMARECFEHLDYLEARLSRFIEGSDISRVNRMRAGETLYISEASHQCLLLALQVHTQSGGLFDATLGTLIEHRKSGNTTELQPPAGSLIIHPDAPAITCESPGREVDLGGIGKGFALDEIKKLLVDWEAGGALLAAGASTLLAYGEQAWPVDLAGDSNTYRIPLLNRALGASGTGIQGSHIIHPCGRDMAYLGKRAWVLSPAAALADAWSTAAMLMGREEVMEIMSRAEDVQCVFAEHDGGIEHIGGN